jgi:hypothetical protein
VSPGFLPSSGRLTFQPGTSRPEPSQQHDGGIWLLFQLGGYEVQELLPAKVGTKAGFTERT